MESSRCAWPGDDELYVQYHDQEWGYPEDNDKKLFEKICLEGFQAGLAWITILRKREHFEKLFLISISIRFHGTGKRKSKHLK